MAVHINSSNFTDPVPCILPEEKSLKAGGMISDYDILFFICYGTFLTFGIMGNSVCIAAMAKRLKKENVYYFQLPIMMSDLMACIFCIPLTLYQPYIVRATPGPNWAKRNFYFSWYGAVIGTPLDNWFITCSLVLLVVTSLDRLQAIAAPQIYATSNQKRRALIASISCLLIGFATSVHDCWRRSLVYCTGTDSYEIVLRIPTTLQTTMEFIRIGVRVVSLISLAIATVVTAVKYIKLQQQRDKIRTHKNEEKAENQDAVRAKLLIRLSTVQCCTMIGGLAPLLTWYLHFYILSPLQIGFTNDQAATCLKVSEIMILFPICFTFLFYIFVSKRFRNTVRQLFGQLSVVSAS